MEGWVDLGYRIMHRPGVELAILITSRHPSHYTNEPPMCKQRCVSTIVLQVREGKDLQDVDCCTWLMKIKLVMLLLLMVIVKSGFPEGIRILLCYQISSTYTVVCRIVILSHHERWLSRNVTMQQILLYLGLLVFIPWCTIHCSRVVFFRAWCKCPNLLVGHIQLLAPCNCFW